MQRQLISCVILFRETCAVVARARQRVGDARCLHEQLGHEQLGDRTRNYRQLTFIAMGIEPDDRFERQAREEAAKQGWSFDQMAGDPSFLIRRLADGPWDDGDFLVVPPGVSVRATYDEGILEANVGRPEPYPVVSLPLSVAEPA